MNLTWRNPPANHWYAAKSPSLSLQYRSSRAHQTALARLRSGPLRSMTFVQGIKSFFTCPCSLLASPAHLLDCWGISLQQLYEEQGLVCETITCKGQMDLRKAKNGPEWHSIHLPTADIKTFALSSLVELMATVAEWSRLRIEAGLVTSSSPVSLKTLRVGVRGTLNLSRAQTSSRWTIGEGPHNFESRSIDADDIRTGTFFSKLPHDTTPSGGH
ncbi:uncharacterized protein TNCV_3036201 [Trichonephila clavipes]|nr:uncharacterized protein TNCV_3036201 [Trichonephila clavipes]